MTLTYKRITEQEMNPKTASKLNSRFGSDLLGVLHFDGSLLTSRGLQPTLFSRSSAAINPETLATVPAGTPVFVNGKFGQALEMWDATTNLIPYSGFEGDVVYQQTFLDPMTSAGAWSPRNSGSAAFSASGMTLSQDGTIMETGAVWAPMNTVNNGSIQVTYQVTFTTPATPADTRVSFAQSGGDSWDIVFAPTGSAARLESWIGGSLGSGNTENVSGFQNIVGSSTYTAVISVWKGSTISFDIALYSGSGTGGAVLGNVHFDSGIGMGFSPAAMAVGGNAGTVFSNASVKSPFPAGWTIGGDTRVAWGMYNYGQLTGNYYLLGAGIDGVQGWIYAPIASLTATKTYTLSYYGYAASGTPNCGPALVWEDSSGNPVGGSSLTAASPSSSVFGRMSSTIAAPAGVSKGELRIVMNSSGTAGFDCLQLEQQEGATPYFDNATSGTAARSMEDLYYDISLANKYSNVTIHFFAKSSLAKVSSGANGLLSWRSGKTAFAGLQVLNGVLQLMGNSFGTIDITEEHSYGISLSGSFAKVYVDGNLLGTVPLVISATSSIHIGDIGTSTTAWNGWIDEVSFFNRVLSDDEMMWLASMDRELGDDQAVQVSYTMPTDKSGIGVYRSGPTDYQVRWNFSPDNFGQQDATKVSWALQADVSADRMAFWHLVAGGTTWAMPFSVTGAGAVATTNNTLDDGSGAATLAGALTLKPQSTAANSWSQPLWLNAINSSSATTSAMIQGDSNGGLVLNSPAGGSNFAVYTRHNILDDGITGVAQFGKGSGGTKNGNVFINPADAWPEVQWRSGGSVMFRIQQDIVGGVTYFDGGIQSFRRTSDYAVMLELNPSNMGVSTKGSILDDGSGNSSFSSVTTKNSGTAQYIHQNFQHGSVARWKFVTESNANFTIYDYDSGGGSPRQAFQIDKGTALITAAGNASFNGAYIGGNVSTGFYQDANNLALRAPNGDVWFQNAGGVATYARIGQGVGGVSLQSNTTVAAGYALTVGFSVTSLTGNQIQVGKNNPTPSNSLYANGNIEVVTNDGSVPSIGWHRAGYYASAMYLHSDSHFHFVGSDGADYRLPYFTISSAAPSGGSDGDVWFQY